MEKKVVLKSFTASPFFPITFFFAYLTPPGTCLRIFLARKKCHILSHALNDDRRV